MPDLLGTYGDRGNAIVLSERLRKRGHDAEIVDVPAGTAIPGYCDIYVLGGGEDQAQVQAVRLLERSPLLATLDRGTPVLAVCAGLQILGERTLHADGTRSSGLGVLDITTQPGARRAIGEVLADATSALALADPVLCGFENHRGRTTLGPSATPLARLNVGVGNGDGTEGVISGNIVGTYLHGPVLARNPCLADYLLAQITGCGQQVPLLLDDLPGLRQDAISAARKRKSLRRRFGAAVTPKRWLAPGVPTVASREDPR